MMRILFCCEYFHPSIGGVQEVVKQLAVRLHDLGHQVSVATTLDKRRKVENSLKGILIHEFDISGNDVNGITGNRNEYCEFLIKSDFDIIVFKAAQQWTFDIALPLLKDLRGKKVFIPCGFSGLFDLRYKGYYLSMLPNLIFINKFIFYTENYRDINYLKQFLNIGYSVVSNGADEGYFKPENKNILKKELGLSKEDLLFLSVGTLNGQKGHWELCMSYLKTKLNENSVLYFNANIPQNRFIANVKLFLKDILSFRIPYQLLLFYINHFTRKKIVVVDLDKQGLYNLYTAADLFLFASNIEYSPLVLFEALASGTPFISGNVGNAAEIASKTSSGFIAHTRISAKGYSYINTQQFANLIDVLCADRKRLEMLSLKAIKDFQYNGFSWKNIVLNYENIFNDLIKGTASPNA